MVKTLLIGLDGATWDVINPFIDQGILPTFNTLTTKGAWGTLESTIPPVTGPAWVSLATGKNPGKTGVIDFLKRSGSTLKAVTSSDFKNVSFWDLMSSHNTTVGIVNFPMLFPPYTINGFMVSGLNLFDSEDITFPKSLKKIIDDLAPEYEIAVNYHKGYDNEDIFLEKVYRILKERTKVISYLLKEVPVEVFVVIFSCTDWVQHVMWKHTDPLHPLYNPELSPRYNQKFTEFWITIDKTLKTIIELAGDANVFLVSDHGFGIQDQQFNLAKWLEEKGYMSRAGRPSLKERVSRLIQEGITTPVGVLVPSRVKRRIMQYEPTPSYTVDFEASTAFCLGHTIPFGGIYIKDRGKEYQHVKERLIQDVSNIGKDIQKEVSITIFLPEDMYYGENMDQLPDILFTINGWRCTITENSTEGPLFIAEPYSKTHTGSHRVNGIFVAYGPDIVPQPLRPATLYDIAPTLLYMHGVPIPEDMDGRILDIFKKGSDIARKKMVYKELDEKEKIQKRIKHLKRSGKL